MLNILDPLAKSKELRVYNNIWALRKMIMEIGDSLLNNIKK